MYSAHFGVRLGRQESEGANPMTRWNALRICSEF